MTDPLFQIRDRRKPGHHWADNEVMDIFGPMIGMAGYAIYMYICRWSGNEDGRCYKSHRDIAKSFGCSPDTVQRHVSLLIKSNLIHIEPRPGRPSIYVVHEAKNLPQIALPLALKSGENQAKDLPQDAAPTYRKLRHLPTASCGDHLPQSAAPLPQIAAPHPQIAVGTLYGSRALDFTLNLYEDLKPGEGPPASATASPTMIIAHQRLMEGIGKKMPGDPALDEALFHSVRSAAKRAGLSYSQAKNFLAEDPEWRRWRWFAHLDTQTEMAFPEPSKIVPPVWPEDFERDGKLWFDLLKELKKKVSENIFDTWLKPTMGYGRWRGIYFVHVPTPEFKHIGKKFSDEIKILLAGQVNDIRFITEDELSADMWKVSA